MIGIGPGAARAVGRMRAPRGLVPAGVTLYDAAGATPPAALPGLRISLDGGATWQGLAQAGLTVAAQGGDLVLAGFADAASAASTLFHHEQAQPGEPYAAARSIGAVFTRAVGAPAPDNPALPGFALAATPHDSPVVTT
ncbi:hypothetical protein [Limimaricola sp.]|uniref:hypothetical protein n=1 Tax=Limimaricola sp. TaxID=2211665 RepID=UPI0040594B92